MQRIVADLTDTLGFAHALQIVRRWGGRSFRVPVKVAADDAIALVLGLEPAQRLVKHYAGQVLQLPAERHVLLDMRNAAIFRACEVEKRSQESVGVEFGLTRQGVAAVLAKVKAQAPQEIAGTAERREAAESGR